MLRTTLQDVARFFVDEALAVALTTITALPATSLLCPCLLNLALVAKTTVACALSVAFFMSVALVATTALTEADKNDVRFADERASIVTAALHDSCFTRVTFANVFRTIEAATATYFVLTREELDVTTITALALIFLVVVSVDVALTTITAFAEALARLVRFADVCVATTTCVAKFLYRVTFAYVATTMFADADSESNDEAEALLARRTVTLADA